MSYFKLAQFIGIVSTLTLACIIMGSLVDIAYYNDRSIPCMIMGAWTIAAFASAVLMLRELWK